MRGKRSVRRELLRTMSMISVITILIVGSVLSAVMFRQSTTLLRSDMQFYTSTIYSKLANHLRLLEDAVLYIQKNEKIKTFLQNEDEMDAAEEALALSAMENGIHLFSEWNMVEEIYPFLKDLYILNEKMEVLEIHFYPESSVIRDRKRERITDEVKEYRGGDEIFMHKQYGGDIEIYFSLYDDYMQKIGYGAAVIDRSSVEKIFSVLDKYEHHNYMIINKDGTDILGQGITGLKEAGLTQAEGETRLRGKAFYYSQYGHSFELQSIILIRKDSLYHNVMPAFVLAWMLAASVMLVSIVVISYNSQRITKPLQTIVGKLGEVGRGDFGVQLEDYSLNEFHEISESFNDMTGKIQTLIKEVYENELIAKDAMLHYLQAQIDPHFLFNVLTMISLRSKMRKDEETYRMVHSLAGLMQGKIFRKNEIEIPIMDEMQIVEFYLYLSSERFKDRVKYEIIWEKESLKECFIPKLSVEPIVENAVIHGIEPKSDLGFIQVRVSEDGGKLLITVTDDGVGFDTQKAYDENSARHPRVGIMNTTRLLHNLYGEEYGIRVESNIGEGSKVEIVLPLAKEKLT